MFDLCTLTQGASAFLELAWPNAKRDPWQQERKNKEKVDTKMNQKRHRCQKRLCSHHAWVSDFAPHCVCCSIPLVPPQSLRVV